MFKRIARNARYRGCILDGESFFRPRFKDNHLELVERVVFLDLLVGVELAEVFILIDRDNGVINIIRVVVPCSDEDREESNASHYRIIP